MKSLLVALSLLLGSQSISQKMEVEFGKITNQELELDSYEKDKEAKAVILYDKGNSIFIDTDKGYDIRFTRHKRIKIFDKSESQNAEVIIPYFVDGYGKTEIVKSIEAFTYNYENGRQIKKELDPSTIYQEQIDSRRFNKKFVFPDVQNGSVLEYRYVLETPFHFNLPDWIFQAKVPTIYSEYEVSMIPFYEYIFRVQGTSNFDYRNSVIAAKKRSWGSVVKALGENVGNGIEFRDYVHTFVLQDVPAFKDESYITSYNDYIIKMDFQLAKFHSPKGYTTDVISTWPALNKALLKEKDFGKYLKNGSREARKILKNELQLSGLNESDKAIRIIEYIKNSFEWNGDSSKYASQSINDFMKKRIGNSADINLLLIALLNEADVDAEPLILSSRNHGKLHRDYPFSHYTNYVIALVKTTTPFLADGTENLLPYNMLPSRCLNEIGLVVNKSDEPQWVKLVDSKNSLQKQVIIIDIDPTTLDAKTRVSVQSTDYSSYLHRKEFGDDTLKIKKYFADKIGNVENVKTRNYDNTSLPYSMNFLANYETEKINQNIILRPFLRLPLSINHLKQKERNYPVDLVYAREEQFESIVKVPLNYSISTLPKPFKVDDELAEINLEYIISEGALLVKGNYKFKKPVYAAKEYTQVKNYFDQIVKHFNQPVMLELNE